MIKISKAWSFNKHFVFSILISVIIKLIHTLLPLRQASSIGIIGSADGPTTIFIAGEMNYIILSNLLYIAIFICLTALYRPIKLIIESIFYLNH